MVNYKITKNTEVFRKLTKYRNMVFESLSANKNISLSQSTVNEYAFLNSVFKDIHRIIEEDSLSSPSFNYDHIGNGNNKYLFCVEFQIEFDEFLNRLSRGGEINSEFKTFKNNIKNKYTKLFFAH